MPASPTGAERRNKNCRLPVDGPFKATHIPAGQITAVVAVSQFTGSTGRDTPFGTQMAAGVILTIPLVIMVLAFQRRIVSGLTAGGVK